MELQYYIYIYIMHIYVYIYTYVYVYIVGANVVPIPPVVAAAKRPGVTSLRSAAGNNYK